MGASTLCLNFKKRLLSALSLLCFKREKIIKERRVNVIVTYQIVTNNNLMWIVLERIVNFNQYICHRTT